MGIFSKTNSPASLLLIVCSNAEPTARIFTIAPLTGRCCGSWIKPRTEPRIEATASGVISRKPRLKSAVTIVVRLEYLERVVVIFSSQLFICSSRHGRRHKEGCFSTRALIETRLAASLEGELAARRSAGGIVLGGSDGRQLRIGRRKR